jgi:hypothetical protein
LRRNYCRKLIWNFGSTPWKPAGGKNSSFLKSRPQLASALTDVSPIRLSCKSKEAIMQSIQHTEISRQSSNLFSAREVAQTIGADLETINEWLEVGAIDRAVFGGGRFSKYELQRAALTLELVKLGLAPSCAKAVIWEMEYELQQIWGEAISKRYKAYAIVIPNKQKKWLVFWCWKTLTEEIEPTTRGDIILPVSDILARVANQTKQASED